VVLGVRGTEVVILEGDAQIRLGAAAGASAIARS